MARIRPCEIGLRHARNLGKARQDAVAVDDAFAQLQGGRDLVEQVLVFFHELERSNPAKVQRRLCEVTLLQRPTR